MGLNKFRDKLLALGVTLTALPLILLGAAVWHQNRNVRQAAAAGCLRLAESDLNHMADVVYALCDTNRSVLEHDVRQNLRAAKVILERAGGVHIAVKSESLVRWEAQDQFTKATSVAPLPSMSVGESWLGQIRDPRVRVAVVDDIQQLTGATSTVFQRMNEKGDMLRVATNMIGADGNRAIGTFIPATGSDGQPNPVVSAVMRGETYVGRAFVVNGWYLAAYEPLLDRNKKVIGMLYVGVPEAIATENLRRTIMKMKVGQTGYVYVLNATCPSRGPYVISKEGRRDGEDIWNSEDSTGARFIQEICRKALALRPTESATHTYPWKNPGDQESQLKIARIKYYKPWDWVIGVSVPQRELLETVNSIESISYRSASTLLALTLATIALSATIWFVVTTRLTRRAGRIAQDLSQTCARISAAAARASESSRTLAADASEQAAANNEVSTSLTEIAAQAEYSVGNSRVLKQLAAQTRGAAETGSTQIRVMKESMGQIQSAGAEVVKINKMIDEIAFQTNILALNAAVEAARAGDAGLGFAVVADEVRNLARRSAEAARETSEKIQRSIIASRQGASVTDEVAHSLEVIADNSSKLDVLVQSFVAGSEKQSQSIAGINTAAEQMRQSIQSTAANADEGAIVANQFCKEAQTLDSLAKELTWVFQGAR